MREVAWTEGDVVRKLRSAAGWKLEQLAERTGLHFSVIHNIEVGRTKEAKRETRQKLAAAFGLTLREFEDLVPTVPVRLNIDPGQQRAASNLGERQRADKRRRQGHG